MNTKIIVLCLVLSMSIKLSAGDDNWPRFRGVNGSGISAADTVPVMWMETNYNWKITLPGLGHSSPVVWGNRIFVTCGDPQTAKRIVLCIDTVNGRTIWQRDFESKPFRQHGENSYATATPAVDANGVVVCWTTPDAVMLVALDNDGKDIWLRNLGPFIGIQGSGASPVIVDDFVVYNNDQEDPAALPASVYGGPGAPKTAGKSFVIALERKSGKIRWQTARRSNQSAYMTPCINITSNGLKEIILAGAAHGVTGMDLATGKVNWELAGVFTERCIGSPVTGSGLIIAAEGKGSTGTRLIAVQPGPNPKIAYEIQKPVPFITTPLVRGDRLFLWSEDGNVSCLRLSTGECLWREKVSGMFYSSPVCVNGRLYCTTKQGDVVVISAGDKYELLARVSLGEKCFATPAIAGGVIYFRTFTQLFSLGKLNSPRQP